MKADPIEALGREVAREHDAARRPDDYLGDIRERVLDLTPVTAPRFGKRRWQWLAAAAALLTLVAMGIGIGSIKPVPVVVVGVLESTGETVAVGQWVSTTTPTALRFSEGTKLTLNGTTRARLLSADAAEAHLLVETGEVDVDVIPHQSANWRISTGPFQVRVKGTQFSVRWDPDRDTFELELRRGTVVVSGCVFGEGRTIEPGETVRAACRSGRFEVARSRGARAGATAETAGTKESGADRATDPTRTERDRPSASPEASQESWRGLVRDGKYSQAFVAADALGFERACQAANPAELSSLGDGARYAGAIPKASQAYRTLRQRFPGTDRAAVAAFSLARIEFDQRGVYAEAARWFKTYLDEQPRGHLAREARGRLMEALHRSGDPRGAKEAARAYLKAYSDGPHAAQARALVGSAAKK